MPFSLSYKRRQNPEDCELKLSPLWKPQMSH